MGFVLGTLFSFLLNIGLALVKFIVKILKNILISTRLILPALYAAIAAALYFTGVVQKDSVGYSLLVSGFIAAMLLWVYLIIAKFFRQSLKRQKTLRKQEEEYFAKIEKRLRKEKKIPDKEPVIEKADGKTKMFKGLRPKVYRVKQDNRFIMHEYPDRVELFEETGSGLRYVRTDYNEK